MKIELSIHNEDEDLTTLLFGKYYVKKGDKFEILPSCWITIKDNKVYRSIEVSQVLEIIIDWVPEGVAAGVIANWFYDKLKRKKLKLKYNNTEVKIEKEEITKIINTQLTIEE